jgi:hypothetical protein
MGKIIATLALSLLLINPVAAAENEVCAIPVPLPPWQGLVLRLWGTGRISDEAFLKTFPISGEAGDKMLEALGFNPLELKSLAHCLIKSFKGKSNGNRTP